MATPIWNFGENEAVDNEKVDLKPFKPTGKFFADSQVLMGIFKCVTHPAIRESSYREPKDKLTEEKEITVLNFYKYRIDHNTLRITQLALAAQTTILTLK